MTATGRFFHGSEVSNRLPVRLFVVVTLMTVAIYVTRLSLPSDLADNHQNSPVAYVLDVLHNGSWICQRDVNGAIASKPPLSVWMAAFVSKNSGTVSRFTLSLPSALATLGLVWIVMLVGNSKFGWRAGLFGAMAYLLSTLVAKQILLVRTDGLFSFWVAVAALSAWRAWERGRGWTLFWLAAAAATLTKGPLGLVLAGSGLLAVVWERRSGEPVPIRGGHGLGIACFLLITAGWLLLAYIDQGEAVLQKLFAQELMQGVVTRGGEKLPLIGFYRPPLYFLSRFAPWGLGTAVAAWRIYRSPASNPSERRFERFLFCWFFAGLLLFSLAAHHRADLLLPLLPPAALLTGREIGRVIQSWKPVAVFSTAIASAVLFLAAFIVYSATVRSRQDGVLRTGGLREMAELVEDQVGPGFPLIHVNTSVILQLHLGTFERWVAIDRAAELLRGADPVFVAVEGIHPLSDRAATSAPKPHVVAEIHRANQPIRILSNHPRLEWAETMVHYSEPFLIRLKGVQELRRRRHEFWLTAAHGSASVTVTNESEEPRRITLNFLLNGAVNHQSRLLAPKESWRFPAGN